MATGSPACALLHADGVIRAADAELSALHLLEMTFQAEVRIARDEHLGVDRAVRAVTRGAAFVHRFMLEHVRAALSWVAFQTGFILCFQCRAAAEMDRAFVRRMTFRAIHPAFGNGMMTRQIELAANVGVALEADGFLRPGGGHDEGRAMAVCGRSSSGEAEMRGMQFS